MRYSKTFKSNKQQKKGKPCGIRIIISAFISLTTHFSYPFQSLNKLNVFSLKWHFKNGQYIFDKLNKTTTFSCHSRSYSRSSSDKRSRANSRVVICILTSQSWSLQATREISKFHRALQPQIYFLLNVPCYSPDRPQAKCSCG